MASDFDIRTIITPGAPPPNPNRIIDRAAPASQTGMLWPELVRRLGLTAEIVAAALSAAETNGTRLHAELLAAGVVTHVAYAQALAGACKVICVTSASGVDVIEARAEPVAGLREVVGRIEGRDHHIVDAASLPPDGLACHIARLAALDCPTAIAPRSIIDTLDAYAQSAMRLDEAVNGLRRRNPTGSAASPWRKHQLLGPVMLVGFVLGGLLVMPERTLSATALLLGLPFLSVTVLRLIAFREVLASRRRRARAHIPLQAAQLPTYAVLVPLYRETEVLPDLLAALGALDYPASKLDVILLIEATDLAMQTALLLQALPAHVRVVIVPDGQPRTKPKALNYGLQFARGDLVVVFDAEDRPQPQQMKRAAEVFARAPAVVACVQAQLNVYNPRDTWFTRQFTIEYSTLFDAVLPALERLSLPIPLGGTSNHFRGLMQQAHL